MSYIGNTSTTQAFTPAIDYFSGNASTTAFTLSRPVASVAQVEVYVSNVPQTPGTAFSVSGNTITFTSAPPTGTNNIYIYYTSPVTQVITPGQQTVGPSQFTATGTPSSSTYLRGDNTWSTISTGLPGVLGQAFTTTGTFTIPANVTALKVTVVGGGGSGGTSGAGGCGSTSGGAAGGGAGGSAISYLTGLTPGNTISVTVGAAGGSSSISSGTQTITTVTCTAGGSGGVSGGVGGSGGSGSGGTINQSGGAGGNGLAGGTSGGNTGGVGGASLMGGGGRGGNVNGGGSGGASYGSGGGGGGGNGGTPQGGGSGAQGIVIFEW